VRKEIEPVYQWQDTGELCVSTRDPELELIRFEVPTDVLTMPLKDGRKLRLNPVSPTPGVDCY